MLMLMLMLWLKLREVMKVSDLVIPEPHKENDGVSSSDTLSMTIESLSQNLMYVLLGEINQRAISKKVNLEDVAKKLNWSISKTYRVKDSDIKNPSNLSRVIILAQACDIKCDITVSIKK